MQQIGKPVVVEVADRDPHPVDFHVEAGGAGHVGERAVAVVAVQPERRPLPLVTGPVHAVDQQDVLPPVAVVVEEGATRAERFRQEGAAEAAVVVTERQPGRGGDVDQLEWRRRGPLRPRPIQRQRRRQRCLRRAMQERAPVHGSLTRPFCIA